MIPNKNLFNPPMENLLNITPNDRKILMQNLIANYGVYFPHFRLVYAAINYSSKHKLDYIVLFETEIEKRGAIVWSAPLIYTPRSLPGYRYAIENGLINEFFDLCNRSFVVMERYKFMQYLKTGDKPLTIRAGSSKDWRDPKNLDVLIEKIQDISIWHRPDGFSSALANKKV